MMDILYFLIDSLAIRSTARFNCMHSRDSILTELIKQRMEYKLHNSGIECKYPLLFIYSFNLHFFYFKLIEIDIQQIHLLQVQLYYITSRHVHYFVRIFFKNNL